MSRGCITERKGKNGSSWQLKYTSGKDPLTGKRKVHYVTVKGAKKDAQKELRRLLTEVDKGVHVDPSKLVLSDWIVKWSDGIKATVSNKTFERYTELLRLHVAPSLGEVQLQKLSPLQIQELYSKLRIEGKKSKRQDGEPTGLSERTILHVHRVLSECLSNAEGLRLINRNPASDVKAPRPEARRSSEVGDDSDSESFTALDANQLAKLLDGFKGHSIYPIVATAATTGMRSGEILALKWSDIDFERREIRIQRSVEDTNKHGVRFKPPKNKSSKRTIGIDEGLISVLKAQRLPPEALMKYGIRMPPDALVFPPIPHEWHTPRRPRSLSKQFRRIAESIGFKGFRFHDLRHTHATLLLLGGVPVNAVAQRLGHSKPVMTLNVYGHVLKRSEDKAVSVAAEILKSITTKP